MRARAAQLVALLAALALPAQAAELLSTTPRPLAPASTGGALPADTVFMLTTAVEADGDVMFVWEMPPSHYLYRKKLAIEHGGKDLTGALELPQGKIVTDEFFGESEVYFERLLARLPAGVLQAAPGTTLELQLTYQGCLEDIYCYPPQHKSVSVTLP